MINTPNDQQIKKENEKYLMSEEQGIIEIELMK